MIKNFSAFLLYYFNKLFGFIFVTAYFLLPKIFNFCFYIKNELHVFVKL